MKKIIFITLAMVITVCLLGLANEKQTSQEIKENEGPPSGSWKEYRRVGKIWPQLKKEGIESIRICDVTILALGGDSSPDFEEDVNALGYRERTAEVVKWWPTTFKVPKEKLPECIELIDKLVNDTQRIPPQCGSFEKVLIVTSKGNYIFPEEDCVSEELGKFLVKYCSPLHEHWYALPPKEQTVAILIFSDQHPKGHQDSDFVWPPIALFGNKYEAEKLLCRSFEPKMAFEGRGWLEKIMTEYEIAMKDAEERHWREEDSRSLKGWLVFLTQDEFYDKGIGIDGNPVFGAYITESKLLKKYFDELGLTKELLAGEPNTVRNPQADKAEQN